MERENQDVVVSSRRQIGGEEEEEVAVPTDSQIGGRTAEILHYAGRSHGSSLLFDGVP